MKTYLLAAALCLLTTAFARAEGESSPAQTQVKAPAETVDVPPEASTGLFERVREAHIRAVQKGSVVGAKKS